LVIRSNSGEGGAKNLKIPGEYEHPTPDPTFRA